MFESSKFKFELGDYVRSLDTILKAGSILPDDTIYKIDEVDDDYYYIVSIDPRINVSTWIREEDLIKISDYEVSAIKYNL